MEISGGVVPQEFWQYGPTNNSQDGIATDNKAEEEMKR